MDAKELGASIAAVSALLVQLKQHRATRRKQFFDMFVAPLFETMTVVHTGYRSMFADVLVKLDEAAPSSTFQGDSPTLAKLSSANKARNMLVKARQKNDSFRASVRRDAASFIEVAPNPEARRFLYAVIRYFLDDHLQIEFDERQYDIMIEWMLENGSWAALESPSKRLTNELVAAVTPHAMREIIESAMAARDMLFGELEATFRAAKVVAMA